MKKTLTLLCFATLCSITLLAHRNGQHIVRTEEKSKIHIPAPEAPAGLQKIYSNLGTKTDAYNDLSYWLVAGPNSGFGTSEFYGLPFTPKANSHVSQVQVALQYQGSGANQVNLSIYGDSSGTPGILLAGPVTVANLPGVGTCCVLAVADFPSTALTAGTRYWVVADTPVTGTGSDFLGAWATVAKPVILMSANIGGTGWFGLNADSLVAGAVFGTIP